MKVNFFIDHPVFSMVISILIVIVGFIGLTLLPIDQYPQIPPPVVKISASYPGASATTVSQAVATPIEQELNGTPGMIYMESSSSNSGGFSATVTFDVSTDANLAAVEVQNRLKLAESRLPGEVVQNGISVEKQAASQLMTICLTSDDPKFDEIYLSNFATLNVLDLLRRIPGVGRVSNVGSRYYAMQIWVQPDKLASFGLTVKDLQTALKDQNTEAAAGVMGQQPVSDVDITIPITTQGRLSTVSQFENIYTLYGDFQTRMERYWSLRWIMQESVGQIEAIVVKGDLVRIDGLPFMQRVPGLPEDLPRGRKVLLQIMGCDLVDLVMDSRLLRVLDETADTSDEDEDEEAALEEQAAVEGGEEAQGGDTVSESSAS